MHNTPFRRVPATLVAGAYPPAAACCNEADEPVSEPTAGRARLTQLNPHLHCSVIGTCLSTAELRRIVARFTDVQGRSDLEVHHDAVSLAGQGGAAAKALHKALDQRHDSVVRQFAKANDASALGALWDEAHRQGEIPGAYWALLTHRQVTPELRQRAFGDVHMLSHLVGAANRADIRRLVALERDNAELRERLDRRQQRAQETLAERDQQLAHLQQELAAARLPNTTAATPPPVRDAAGDAAFVALQTQRRERAEQSAAAVQAEADRLRDELEHLQRHVATLNRELAAVATQLRETGAADDAAGSGDLPLAAQLHARRILYVGGRPSSTTAIRALVQRHGGEFQRHDGGLEDRKGLLASAVAAADLVVFPVDCIDHDSAGNLKRLCGRQGIAFLPVRSASVASFAAGLASRANDAETDADAAGPPFCLKHG